MKLSQHDKKWIEGGITFLCIFFLGAGLFQVLTHKIPEWRTQLILNNLVLDAQDEDWQELDRLDRWGNPIIYERIDLTNSIIYRLTSHGCGKETIQAEVITYHKKEIVKEWFGRAKGFLGGMNVKIKITSTSSQEVENVESAEMPLESP